jgi:serine/threonine-protein kinase RsbW
MNAAASKQSSQTDVVSLRIPGHPQYVGIIRLAVSGLANRLELPFDEAEDLKLAVTEACAHILRNASKRIDLQVHCKFSKELLEIQVKGTIPSSGADTSPQDLDIPALSVNGEPDLGVCLIEALMDTVDIDTDDETGVMMVSMARRLIPNEQQSET